MTAANRHQLFLFQKILILPAVFAITISAQTHLSGSIGEKTLEKSGNPFIVDENLIIPAGKKVTILEGCVFLFQPFTGIVVEGSLAVKGTRDEPVLFTSINDTSYNPNGSHKPPEAFDWNGLHFKQRSRDIELSEFVLQYSVYGIKSQIEDIRINRGIFSANGQFHFTINDAIQPVVENIPYTYGVENEEKTDTISTGRTTLSWRRPTAIGSAVAGAVACASLAYSLKRKSGYAEKYDAATDPDDFDHYSSREQSFLNYALISGALGITFFTTGTTLFIVDHIKRKEMSVVIEPYIGFHSGISMTIQF